MAAARLFAFVAGNGTGPGLDDAAGIGMVLVPVLAGDGSVLVRESELTRVEALVNESRSGRLLTGTGDPGEIVNAAEAARLIGASRSYVARLCRTLGRAPGRDRGRRRDRAGPGRRPDAPTWRQAGMPAAGGGSAGRTWRRSWSGAASQQCGCATTSPPPPRSPAASSPCSAVPTSRGPVRLVAVPTQADTTSHGYPRSRPWLAPVLRTTGLVVQAQRVLSLLVPRQTVVGST